MNTPQPAVAAAPDATSMLLEATAYNLWMSALRGTHFPAGASLYDRMSNPKVGDYVLETSSYLFMRTKQLTSGILVSMDGATAKLSTKFVVRPPVGNLIEWTNCKFVAIPPLVHNWYPATAPSPDW